MPNESGGAIKRGVAPGCKRIHLDIPEGLHEKIAGMASEPPAISVAEWCRRVLAHYAKWPLPSQRERRAQGLRLTGEPKMKTGPKKSTDE